MDASFSPDQAALLAGHVHRVAMAARELAHFSETDPDIVAECGLEVSSLEARMALSGGAPARIAAAAADAAASGRNARVRSEDLDTMTRLEGVLALAGARMDTRIAAIDAEQSQMGLAKLGSLIGFATGAVGLVKSIF
jgi:hypothetical protein